MRATCATCGGREWIDGKPCPVCRAHVCRRCQGTEEVVLGMDPSDWTGGTLIVIQCPDCAPPEPSRWDYVLPAELLA